MPMSVMAQDSRPVTWVNYMQAKPGHGGDLMQLVKKYNAPVMDGLVDDGTLVSWGVAVPMTHLGQTWTHMMWASVADWSGMEKLVRAMDEADKSRSEKESQEIEEAFQAAAVPEGHRDVVLRHVVLSAPEPGSGGPAPGYLVLGFYTASPGEGDEIAELYEEVAGPVYDRLKAEGAVTAYGFAAQELDLDPAWSHVSWFFLNDLGGMDRRAKAFAEAQKERSDAQEEMLEAWFEEVLEPAHHDLLLRVVHYAGR
jgi:hypothetical protein